jgi:hypothetical protein
MADGTVAVPIPPPFSSSYSPAAGSSAVPLQAGARDYSSPLSRPKGFSSPAHNNTLLSDMPSRSNSAMGGSSRPRTPSTNIYSTAPDSAGVIYPPPLGINASSPSGIALRVPLPGSTDSPSSTHRRSVSLNAGQTPGSLMRAKALPSRTVTPKLSNTSLGSGKSYSHYDSAAHLDPAYFGSNDRDAVTEANTLANGNGSRPSTALSYATQPGFP